MLGLPKGEVFLVPWCEAWEQAYAEEKRQIQWKIGSYIAAVHHIGSTSVRGLSAKPILDIAVEINDFQQGIQCAAPLEELGYMYHGTGILPERHYFTKGKPRTHQIHMYESGSSYLWEQLAFREYLRDNQEARQEYEQLKQQLSARFKHNKHNYAEAKTEFVHSVLEKVNKK